MQERRNQPGLHWKTFKPVLPSGKTVILQKNPQSRALKQTNCRAPGGTSAPIPEIPCVSLLPSTEGISYFHPRTVLRKLCTSWNRSTRCFPQDFSGDFCLSCCISCWRHLCGMKAFGRNPFWSLLRVTPEGGFGFGAAWLSSGWDPSQEEHLLGAVCLALLLLQVLCVLWAWSFSHHVWIPQRHKGTGEVAACSSLPWLIRENQRNSVLLCLALLTKLGAIRCSA